MAFKTELGKTTDGKLVLAAEISPELPQKDWFPYCEKPMQLRFIYTVFLLPLLPPVI